MPIATIFVRAQSCRVNINLTARMNAPGASSHALWRRAKRSHRFFSLVLA
jgi:hypothetical protein